MVDSPNALHSHIVILICTMRILFFAGETLELIDPMQGNAL